MAKIIIKRGIAVKNNLDRFVVKVHEGKSNFLELPNGNYDYETTDENKKIWDLLDELKQDSCIKSYVEENKDLEIILEEMKQK